MRTLLAAVAVVLGAPHASVAANHHCRNEEPLYASKDVVIAREMTEASDIYVTCWRRTNKHRVVAKFRAEDQQVLAFRVRGEWVVWRYRAGQRDRMGSMNARTGRRGPSVAVPVLGGPARLTKAAGPVAQDVGDADAMHVFIAANGYYAWPVEGALPDDEGGQTATAMYVATGAGGDLRIDFGLGFDALRRIRTAGSTLRWINHGVAKHARLGPRLTAAGRSPA